jgi:hypothetical protein
VGYSDYRALVGGNGILKMQKNEFVFHEKKIESHVQRATFGPRLRPERANLANFLRTETTASVHEHINEAQRQSLSCP